MTNTIANEIKKTGIGLHSGKTVEVRILPDRAAKGRYFARVDLPGKPEVLAATSAVHSTTLSTELCQGTATVRTVEHLLSALSASGVHCARIEIDGPEVPLLDGSAKEWTEAIVQAGIVPCTEEEGDREPDILTQAITVREGDSFVCAMPSSELRFTYGIDFAHHPAIGNQWASWNPAEEPFGETIAPARTFGLAEEIEQLRQMGLIQGGSLDNALVCDRDGWINPPLRFDNEPARHKLLDLVGDLSLLGPIPQAHYLAYKASHKLHVQLARAIQRRDDAIENGSSGRPIVEYNTQKLADCPCND
ncbi:MAG: UDP-3-O-acyl-N-acetylglucosamine deacetylase [Cyanobacteriota bacterium]|nr:UDP-3-O-acyl-N-acetylglucosamine deacetylase [Cyanobacteriota bacterium]